jgi:hypothetical protein
MSFDVLRDLIEEATAFGRIRLLRLGGFGDVVALPDGRETDYVVLGECGHVSSFYTTREAAIRWRCDVCAEAHWHELHTRALVARLAQLDTLAVAGKEEVWAMPARNE